MIVFNNMLSFRAGKHGKSKKKPVIFNVIPSLTPYDCYTKIWEIWYKYTNFHGFWWVLKLKHKQISYIHISEPSGNLGESIWDPFMGWDEFYVPFMLRFLRIFDTILISLYLKNDGS